MTTSREVRDAVGTAPARHKSAAELLKEKRQALASAHERYATAKANRDEVTMAEATRLAASLTVLVTELEQEAAGEGEAVGRKAAEARLLGVRKAYGSLLSEYGEDEERVQQAREVLAEAITKQNARAAKLEALRREASALADRFALPPLKLEGVNEPGALDLPRRWRDRVWPPRIEETTDGTRRQRRDYSEIRDSEGYRIIMTAGLKAFRALTAAEKDIVEREAKTTPDPVLECEAAIINAIPPGVSFADMGVHRG